MLNYGAEAQLYFDYNADDLANNQLTEADQAYATAADPQYTETAEYTGSGTGIIKDLNLSLGSTIEIAGTFTLNGLDASDLELHVTYGSVTDVVDLMAGTSKPAYIMYSDLPVTNVRTTVTMQVFSKTSGECVSNTWGPAASPHSHRRSYPASPQPLMSSPQ